MSDDDWDDSPQDAAAPPVNMGGVKTKAGCNFSAGRGVASSPTKEDDAWNNDTTSSQGNFTKYDSWGGGDKGPQRGEKTFGGGDRKGGREGRGGGRRYNNENKENDGFRRGRPNQDNDFKNPSTDDDAGEEKEKPEKPRSTYIPAEIEDQLLFEQGIQSGINFLKFDEIVVNVTGENPPVPIETFAESGLRPILMQNIEKSRYTKPTPIQKYSIPAVLAGRDLMSCAQTGSGKTAAFLLPIIHNLLASDSPPVVGNQSASPNVVIISPTRELTIQIHAQAKKFAYDTIIKVVLIYGGTSVMHQRARLLSGCHILVATPGRLKDFVNRGLVKFDNCKYFVLDEADRMLDMGFKPDVEEILGNPTMPGTGERQTLMFSATFPEEIQELAGKFLYNYIFLAVGIVGSASTDVEQTLVEVGKFEKREKLMEILKEHPGERTLVFVETKRNADFLASLLSERNIITTSIHGDRYQNEREEALSHFKSGKCKVMVATGVAARGLDIEGVTLVINYDLPKSIDEYVHRIGRTGRVGNSGKAISFYDTSNDSALAEPLAKILTQAKQEVPTWLSTRKFDGGTKKFGGTDIRGNDFGRSENYDEPTDVNEVWS